jgi:hypothetical protein
MDFKSTASTDFATWAHWKKGKLVSRLLSASLDSGIRFFLYCGSTGLPINNVRELSFKKFQDHKPTYQYYHKNNGQNIEVFFNEYFNLGSKIIK